MKQFSFVLDDVKRSKLYYLRFFIQIVAVLLLVSYCIWMFLGMSDFLSKFKIFNDLPEAYLVRDRIMEMQHMEEPDYQNSMLALFEYIDSREDIKLCSHYEKLLSLSIDKPPLDENFAVGISSTVPNGHFPLLNISPGFAEVYDLAVSSGRSLERSDFYPESGRPEYAPVLIGSGYTDYYKVGDIIDGVYEVVGILKPDAFDLRPGTSNGVYYLRDYILTPAIIDQTEESFYIQRGLLIDATLFANDPSAITQYVEKAKELHVFDELDVRSYTDQLESLVSTYKQYIYTYGGIAMLVLLFCVSCAVASMLNYIDAHRTELSIHMLVGAKKRELLLRLAIPPALLLLLASLISLIVFKDLKVFVVLLIFDFLLLFAIMLLPARKLRQQKLYDLLKER